MCIRDRVKSQKTREVVRIINVDEYLKFVDEAYQILDYKNKKFIFVPLSLKFSMQELKEIANYYVKNEYFNIWVDFEGSSVTKEKIARMRTFWREISNAGRDNDIIIYVTNIKREIISNIKDDRTPASDILTSLLGSNIIGINREPPKRLKEPIGRGELEKLREHKARLFDPNTYYYCKLKILNYLDEETKRKLKSNKGYNTLVNMNLTDRELKKQTELFLQNFSLKNYIAQKRMIKEYKDGKLIEYLFKRKIKPITDWF